jgi:hypothetical protein
MNSGIVRVGIFDVTKGKDLKHYKMLYPDYKIYVVMMKSHSKYYPLSPYFLKDDDGRILENIWHFQKTFHEIPKSVQKKSRWDS